MDARPSADAFAETYALGLPQVVWTSLVADLETPVSAFLKLGEGRPYSFLLESVEGGAVRGRYSIIGTKPDLVWRCFGARAEINRRVRQGGEFEPLETPALQSLRELIRSCRITMPEGLPPPAAGLFGQMTYDMVRQMERLPEKNEDRLALPDAVFVRPTLVAVFDNIADRVTLVTSVYPRPDVPASRAYDAALERLADAVADFDRGVRHEPLRRALPPIDPVPNMPPDAFRGMVERAKEYIVAGDIFQVVPSQRFAVPLRPAADSALPRTPSPQPVPLPVLSRPRRLRARGLLARDPGPPARRQGHHPPARRHPPPRCQPRRGRGAGQGAARRPQGAGRAPDAARPRPQRCRPGGGDRHRSRSPRRWWSSITATSCTSSPTSRAASGRGSTRWMP